jgi:hypothetical protein
MDVLLLIVWLLLLLLNMRIFTVYQLLNSDEKSVVNVDVARRKCYQL